MVVSSGGAVVVGGNMFSNFLMWASPCLSSMSVFMPSIHCPSLAETPGPGAENKITLIQLWIFDLWYTSLNTFHVPYDLFYKQ